MRKMLHRMIGGLTVLILLSTPSRNEDALQKIQLRVVKNGDNVTLTCRVSTDVTGFYMHKIKFGYMAQIVATGYDKVPVDGQFKTSRFTTKKEDSLYHFMIRNVSKEDEATYLCHAGTAYKMLIMGGTVLVVNDYKGPNSLRVNQSRSVHLGGSVTFQCSLHSKNEENCNACPTKHNVFWFRAETGESHLRIIYAPGHSSHEEDGRCFYTLTKTVNVSDTGTYYCAVDVCGQILLGGGSTLQPTQPAFPFITVIGILSVCCAMLLVALIISRNRNPVCQCSKGRPTDLTTDVHYSSAEDHRENGEFAGTNYVILDFHPRKTKRQTANTQLPQRCVYSGIQG